MSDFNDPDEAEVNYLRSRLRETEDEHDRLRKHSSYLQAAWAKAKQDLAASVAEVARLRGALEFLKGESPDVFIERERHGPKCDCTQQGACGKR